MLFDSIEIETSNRMAKQISFFKAQKSAGTKKALPQLSNYGEKKVILSFAETVFVVD